MLVKLKMRDNYVIEWRPEGPMQPVVDNAEILSIAFKEVKCVDDFGLLIKLVGPNYDVLWISARFFFGSNHKSLYEEYIKNSYLITGAVFRSEQEADVFKTILEKRYVWEQLKN